MMMSFAVDGAVKSEGYPSMAYHNNQLSQKFPLHHFSGHRGHLEEGSEEDASAILSILTDYNHHRLPHSTSTDPRPKSQDHRQHPSPPADTAPTWLGSAISRQQGQYADVDFLNLSRASEPATEGAPQPSGQWLSWSILHRSASDVGVEEATVSAESTIAAAGTLGHESTDVRNHHGSSNEIRINESVTIATHPNIVHNTGMEREDDGGGEPAVDLQNAKFKADILAHPLYEPLLSVHVTCLRISTPVDQLPRIDAQLEQAQQVVAKYSALRNGDQLLVDDEKEIDQFMMQYALLLSSFKEQLQKHVRVHAMEAVMACWEIEQSLQCLTGTGATMSDDDDGQVGNDTNWFEGGLEVADGMGFGPLNPTKSERSLMERVRHELKHELKQGYKDKIQDMREEILRKRRAGKLPGDTTCVLKSWWQLH